ncbi:MAG: glycosyltransferase [bacterium]
MTQRTIKKIFIGLGGGAEDMLHMTFVARQMRMEIPEAEITWAIGRPYAPLLDNNPDVEHILVVEENWRAEGWQRICELGNSAGYDRKIFFHDPSFGKSTAFNGASRLDCILKAAGVESWLPRRPVLAVREEDFRVAREFTEANRLQSRNQRVLMLEIQPDLLPAPWTSEEYAEFVELLISRLEIKILLCRGGSPEPGHVIEHDGLVDARALTVHQTAALLAQTGDMILGARGGLTLMAVAAGNTGPKMDFVHPQSYRSQEGLAACGYDSRARLIVPKSPEQAYDEIVECMAQNGRLPLGRLRKHEKVPMDNFAESDYYNPARDPLITVLLLARDAESELEDCLKNIFCQSISGGLEVIVLDSGSNQDEESIVRRVKETHRRLRYIRSARECRYATWNRGIKPARGRYLFLMNPHGRLRPGALARLAQYLDGHPDVGMVWGDDESARDPKAALLGKEETRLISRQPGNGPKLIEPSQMSPHLLWRSVLHQSMGMFNPAFEEAGDYEFMLRVARRCPVHYVPGVVGIIQETCEGSVGRGKTFESESQQVSRLYQAIMETGNQEKRRQPPKPLPVVSIILPTWGRKNLLKRALVSVEHQTWPHYEVIVVNCSDAPLEEEISEIDLGEKLRYIWLRSNLNGAVAWNAGLALASGRWIAFLDEGGAYYPNHLESLLEAARESRQPIIYAGTMRMEGFYEGDDFLVTKSEQESALPFSPERLYAQNPLHLQAMLIERSCFTQVGYFEAAADPLSDWELLIRMARRFPFHCMGEITSELPCTSPQAEELLACEMIYRRYDERVESQPDIARARQKAIEELTRRILSSHDQRQKADNASQEPPNVTACRCPSKAAEKLTPFRPPAESGGDSRPSPLP